MISDAQQRGAGGSAGPVPAGGAPAGTASSGGGLFDEIGKAFGQSDSGRNLKDGLGGLVDRFRNSGLGEKADSWVSTGANRELGEGELESAIGDDTLDELARRTGLSRGELVQRLRTALPETVNRLTPGGRVPSESEAQSLI
jgi:uncharacterized protein YidB (DUF937 family)